MVLELVKDKSTMEFFEPSLQAEHLFQAITLKNGLVMYGSCTVLAGSLRFVGFAAWISPPLSISSDEIHDMMGRLDGALTEWESAVL